MYQVQCTQCKSKCWVNGSYESDTNATNINEDEIEFEDYEGDCEHEDWEVIDVSEAESYDDDVI